MKDTHQQSLQQDKNKEDYSTALEHDDDDDDDDDDSNDDDDEDGNENENEKGAMISVTKPGAVAVRRKDQVTKQRRTT